MNFLLTAIITMCAIGLVAAIILYFCSKKFAVEEDPRLPIVNELLPGANCGGCGFAGCSGMAAALIKGADNGSIEGLNCPVGGSEVMTKIAEQLGLSISETKQKVAVVRCNGNCEQRQKINDYNGLMQCSAMNACGMGESGCGYGCLGCGDCVSVCQFDAIKIDRETMLPVVDVDKCSGCGNCAKQCPRNIIELRAKRPKNRMIYVSCVNHDKGPIAMTACKNACIGCSKCQKECSFEAITISGNLSYIDDDKCRLCRKCESVCPTHAIIAKNFPPRKTTVEL